MTRKIDLSKMPTPDLVREFEELATQQGNANDWLDVPRYSKLYKLAARVADELKNRGDLSRLSALFDHKDAWVRYHAATKLHSIMPIEAERVLRELVETGSYQVARDARMSLRPPPI